VAFGQPLPFLRNFLSPLVYTGTMNTENNSREITIEDLAVMVANGFTGIDKRFTGIDQHFTSIDKHFEKLETSLKEFKGETAENFRGARKDMLNLDQKFVTRKEFSELLLKLKLG
jgi:hypothetical protein